MASKVAGVTYLLIAANVMVFVMTLSNQEFLTPDSAYFDKYGLVPVDIMEGKNLFTLVTSLFFHANLLHLGMNMLFLFIAGDGCERAMGSSRFLVFYLACGVLSGLFHAYLPRLFKQHIQHCHNRRVWSNLRRFSCLCHPFSLSLAN